MCQRDQNSFTLVEKYGNLKFSMRLKPITLAEPMAMSEYPEKSQ
jgi:hypothetical protein